MVNLGSTDDSRYTGFREITDCDVLDLQCSCFVGKKIGAVGSGHLELFPFVVLAICVGVNIYFVSKISQELLHLET